MELTKFDLKRMLEPIKFDLTTNFALDEILIAYENNDLETCFQLLIDGYAEKDELQKRNDDLEDDNEGLIADKDDLEEELNQAESDKDALKDENDKFKQLAEHFKSQRNDLKAELEDIKNENAQLKIKDGKESKSLTPEEFYHLDKDGE